MAYTSVRKDKSGRAAIAYAEGESGKGHNGNDVRNQYVGTVNMFPGLPYADQMQPFWNKKRKNHLNEVVVLLQSFSRNEFNPDDPDDIRKASEVGQETVRRFYPGRQAVVFTQIDGKSGLVHNHIYINDVSLETGLACTKEQHKFEVVKQWTNEVTAEFTTLDSGAGKTADKTTQTERVKREQGKWVWKDDLRDRVREAMSQATDEQSFLDNLSKNGVEVEVKDQKKHGHFYTYTLTDFSRAPEGTVLPKKAHARSYNLGDAYGYDALEDMLRYKGITTSKAGSEVGTGGGAVKSEANTEEDKLDFDAFTKRMLLPEEQWVVMVDGVPSIDDEKYDVAKQMFQKYRSGEPFRDEPQDDPADDPKEVTEEPVEQEPVTTEPKHERTHEEKMRILQQKARDNAKRAAEGKERIGRGARRKDLSEITRRIEEASKGKDMEYE